MTMYSSGSDEDSDKTVFTVCGLCLWTEYTRKGDQYVSFVMNASVLSAPKDTDLDQDLFSK